VKAAGLWAPQMPCEMGGLGLNVAGMAACYEAMGRSIFGPAAFNLRGTDDGNMICWPTIASARQKQRVAGAYRRGQGCVPAFAMTEPMPRRWLRPPRSCAPGGEAGRAIGSSNRKWFDHARGVAQHSYSELREPQMTRARG